MQRIVATLLVLPALLFAADITLKSGQAFSGTVVSQSGNSIVLETDGSRVRIAKSMIDKMDGAPYVDPEKAASAGRQQSPPAEQPPATATPETPVDKVASSGFVLGRLTEVTLAGGVVFRGRVLNVNANFVQLDVDKSRVSIAKSHISAVDGKAYVAATPVQSVTQQQGTAAARQSPPTEQKPAPTPPTEPKPQSVPSKPAAPVSTPAGLPWPAKTGATPQPAVSTTTTDAKPVVAARPAAPAPTAAPFATSSAPPPAAAPVVGSAPLDSAGQAELQRATERLRSRLPDNRMKAVVALGAMGSQAAPALSQLIPLLGDTAVFAPATDEGRALRATLGGRVSLSDQTAQSLVKIGTPAVEPLVAALRSPNWVVRAQAVYALGEIRGTSYIAALTSLFSDTSLVVCDAAVDAVTRYRDPSLVYPLLKGRQVEPRTYAIEVLARLKDRRSTPTLLRILRDRDSYVREKAAFALGEIADSTALEELIVALNDNISFVRHNAVEAIGKIGDPTILPRLNEILKDQSDYVREKAILVARDLARNDYRRHNVSAKSLVNDLKDARPDVRDRAANVLWLLSGRSYGQDYAQWSQWLTETGGAIDTSSALPAERVKTPPAPATSAKAKKKP
jgi:HEAT repeat protein